MKWLLLVLFAWQGMAAVVRGRETMQEAASIARRLVRDEGIGTLMSITNGANVEGFDGFPFGSMDYFSDSCPSTGDLMNIKNYKYDRRVSFTVRKHSADPNFHPMNNARMTMFGTLRQVDDQQFDTVKECFLTKHPDAKLWAPRGDSTFHDFHFYTFSVEKIYYIGGFGGLHYLGFLDMKTYRQAQPREDLSFHWQST
ncbi:hypothetical protein BZG36_05078 [Bifiguratus adelaidae]|uniref:CREG-like beta-barrel domain-containing protein n=1 Tax=Bifiguratus adelaidae TaxID=1938954 RepID=A0A261XUJ6_9FUNG|nr:hypothetical protein BZG36_05078 [Bifiguratus adelaidae]